MSTADYALTFVLDVLTAFGSWLFSLASVTVSGYTVSIGQVIVVCALFGIVLSFEIAIPRSARTGDEVAKGEEENEEQSDESEDYE